MGPRCSYCGKSIGPEERAAMCDRCYATHHEECWQRNGRCSTFRCGGAAQSVLGAELASALQRALERANAEPQVCPFCGAEVYRGMVQSVQPVTTGGGVPVKGLLFIAYDEGDRASGWLRRLARKRTGRGWILPGAAINARSCGRCKRLYLWGMAAEELVEKVAGQEKAPFCPRCGGELTRGVLALRGKQQARTVFTCAEIPRFHTDWFGHNILDRYVLNRWPISMQHLPAYSCAKCRYTEVGGRPIYHFM